MFCYRINHEFYHRQGKIIFGAGIIEIPKIHRNMQLAILFSYGDNVRNLCWVLDFMNESRLYEFVDLLFDF